MKIMKKIIITVEDIIKNNYNNGIIVGIEDQIGGVFSYNNNYNNHNSNNSYNNHNNSVSNSYNNGGIDEEDENNFLSSDIELDMFSEGNESLLEFLSDTYSSSPDLTFVDENITRLNSSPSYSSLNSSPSPPSSPTYSNPIIPSSSSSLIEYGTYYEHSSFVSTTHVPASIEASIVISTADYRKGAIERWMAKRSRRCFRKKIVCKARKEYADTRERKGGRFTKSKSPGWIPITEVSN